MFAESRSSSGSPSPMQHAAPSNGAHSAHNMARTTSFPSSFMGNPNHQNAGNHQNTGMPRRHMSSQPGYPNAAPPQQQNPSSNSFNNLQWQSMGRPPPGQQQQQQQQQQQPPRRQW